MSDPEARRATNKKILLSLAYVLGVLVLLVVAVAMFAPEDGEQATATAPTVAPAKATPTPAHDPP